MFNNLQSTAVHNASPWRIETFCRERHGPDARKGGIMTKAWLLASLGFCSLVFGSAWAQDYPTKPIRIISVGGPDITARIIGKKFTEFMGQQIVAENIAGAGGRIAAEAVARSRPDGYTIINGVTSLLIVAAVQKDAPDLSKDFAPIAITNQVPVVLVINQDLPAKSVREFVAFARSQPGKLNFTGANATLAHLAFELFKSMAKVDIVHVPMSTAQQGQAIMSGQVHAMMAPAAQVVGLAKASKMRIVAVTTAQRSRLLPEVPTLAESGLVGYDLVGWNGFLAPLGTPAVIVRRLT